MATFAKPFLPIPDQIQLLKSRNMAFADEPMAHRRLQRVGYYRLSAYWYPFRAMRQGPLAPGAQMATLRADHFIPGTTFEEVFDFYVFDKKLRLCILDGLERIEIALRAIIANHLGVTHPCAHRDPAHLDGNFARLLERQTGQPKHQAWLRRQDQSFARSRQDFAEHFRTKYPSDIPPIWIASEVWDWGMLANFFAGMKPTDKDAVAAHFGSLNGRELETWLRVLNDVRNTCAHHSRLWNRGLNTIPKLPAPHLMPELAHIPRHNQTLGRLYTALALMRVLLRSLHPTHSLLHRRIVNHALAGPTNPIISSAAAGFPPRWEVEPIWT